MMRMLRSFAVPLATPLRRGVGVSLLGCLALVAVPASGQVAVKVGASSTALAAGPLLLASVMPDLFGARGMKLDMVDFRGSAANCVTGVISRMVDMCMVGTTTANDAVAEGAPLKVLAVTARPMSELFLSTRTAERLGGARLATADDRLRALKGLRIVSSGPGSTHWTYLSIMLQRVGLSIRDVNFSTLTDPVAMVQNIRNHQIDGAMWVVGSLGTLLPDRSGVRWISMPRGDAPELHDVPFIAVYAHSAWTEKNPDLATRTHAAFVEAIARMKKDSQGTARAIKAKYYPDFDQAVWDDAYANALPAFIDSGKGVKSGWERLLQIQAESTKKNYGNAAYDKVMLAIARAN